MILPRFSRAAAWVVAGALIVALFYPACGFGQGATPVFSKVGKVVWPAQTWDGILSSASMIFDDGKFKAWYTAGDTAGMVPDSIGYATSRDGMTWSKYEKNPVLTGAAEFQSFPFVLSTSVVKVGGQYFMYYEEEHLGAVKILLATSGDGISWNKCPFPTIEGKPFEGMTPDVVFLDGRWSMWYETGRQIRHAISLDGKAWTTAPTSLRIPGEYDLAFAPTVVVAGGVYSMWFYAAFSYGIGPSRLFYATSTDGASWTTYNENPLPGEIQFWHASAVTVGQTTYLWYTKYRFTDSPDSNIYLATTTMPIPGSETTATQTSSSNAVVASHTTATASQATVTTLPPTTANAARTATWSGVSTPSHASETTATVVDAWRVSDSLTMAIAIVIAGAVIGLSMMFAVRRRR